MNKLLCFLLLACSLSAQADLITLDAYDYALGTNLSDVSEGVWIQQFQKLPNEPFTFSDVLATAYFACESGPCAPREYFSIIGNSTGGLSSVFNNIDGNVHNWGGGAKGLIARFDRPTNFVSIDGYATNDMTQIYAYDLLGNYLGHASRYNTEYGGATLIGEYYGDEVYKNTVTFSSDIDNIAYVILGRKFSRRPHQQLDLFGTGTRLAGAAGRGLGGYRGDAAASAAVSVSLPATRSGSAAA